MAADQKDVVDMDEYEWRAWLRSVTPFVDSQAIQMGFDDLDSDDRRVYRSVGNSSERWAFIPCSEGGEESHAFSVHIDARTRSMPIYYAVLTKITNRPDGRDVAIRYWPHVDTIMRRLGWEVGFGTASYASDGHQNGLLKDPNLMIDGFVALNHAETGGFGLLYPIQQEIVEAWFYEPADLEREALREESEKANPAPKESGRAGRL